MTWARECEHCGGPIPDHKRAHAMYCSKRCNVASSNDAHKAARLEAKAGRWCEWCGDPLPVTIKMGSRFCCRLCQHRARHQRDREARPVQTCPTCGGGFQAKNSLGQRYCSWKCAQTVYLVTGPTDCQHCGAHVATPRRGQRWCSPRCRNGAYKARQARS